MPKQRICIASSGLGHVARGIEAWADDLATELYRRGKDVILCKGGGQPRHEFERIVPCWKREDTKTRAVSKCMPEPIGWRVGMGSGYAIEQTTFARGLLKVLQKENVDVLHVQDPLVALRMQNAFEQGDLKTKTILAHGTEESHDFLDKLQYVQHLAPWHQTEAAEAGFAKRSWTTIPNFVDIDTFRPKGSSIDDSDDIRAELGIPDDAIVVLVAAAIKRGHKRIHYVLEEIASLQQRRPSCPVWLVVAGGWEKDTDALMSLGKELLGDRVRFLVRYPRHRMPDLYRAADIFTLGSLKEMMPLALLEATASGLPCIVHSHPVMEWMIGVGGIGTNMREKGSLSNALISWIDEEASREELGRLARTHALTHFGKDAVVDQILEYYENVASPTRAVEKSTVSVVIPAFNAADTIGRAIDSVLHQSVKATEIIVVDDGSSDNTAEVVRTYDGLVKLIRQPNAKTAAARNHGIEVATGNFVAFLDADDYWESQKLERQLDVIDANPEVSVVGGRFFSETPQQTRSLNPTRSIGLYDCSLRVTGPMAFRVGTMLWTGTVLVRRSCLTDARFVSGLEPAEDRDLWVRLVANHAVFLHSEPLATAVLEPGSISRGSIETDCTRMLDVVQRHRQMLGLRSTWLWKSYVRYRWAANDPVPSTALPMLLRSFVRWPLPLIGIPSMRRLGRVKRLAYLLKTSLIATPSRPGGL